MIETTIRVMCLNLLPVLLILNPLTIEYLRNAHLLHTTDVVVDCVLAFKVRFSELGEGFAAKSQLITRSYPSRIASSRDFR